jgi:hypothetical protein
MISIRRSSPIPAWISGNVNCADASKNVADTPIWPSARSRGYEEVWLIGTKMNYEAYVGWAFCHRPFSHAFDETASGGRG